MKILARSVVATALLVSTQAALADVSANIGVTSNYLWRGVSQSDRAASVSGGLDYSNDSGFYAGAWVGSLSDGDNGFDGSETDLYLGFSGDIADGVGYDVGYIYYMYSTQDDADFSEIYASLSAGAVEAGVAYTVDSQVDETAGADAFIDGDLYYYVAGSVDLEDGFSLGATVGTYTFDDDGVGGADLDYTHYQLDITKSTESMGDFTLTISDTDANSDDAIALEDADIVVSWGTEI